MESPENCPPKRLAKRRKRAPRFEEIAALAGVSVATVDRVLNERDSVSARTRKKVLEAAQGLGLARHLPQAEHRLVVIEILLPRSKTGFFEALRQGFSEIAGLLDRRVVLQRSLFDEGDIETLARAIAQPARPRAGLILAAPDLPLVRDAVAVAQGRGEAVVAVVTELLALAGVRYAGVDNLQAGRAAGHLLGQMAGQRAEVGRVLVFGNKPDYRAHSGRHAGFSEALQHYPALRFELVSNRSLDDPERIYRACKNALARGDVAAIYNSGAGSEGLKRALQEAGYRPEARPHWLTHEAVGEHRALLEQGWISAVIDQDPEGQAMAALQVMLHATGVTAQAPKRARAQFRIHTRYSLPQDLEG